MTIRHPWAVQAIGLAGAAVARCWARTLDYHYHPLDANVDPHRPNLSGHYIYAMWHEYLLLPICRYPSRDVHVLISRHADGQLLAAVCRRLHIPVVHGSTRRGGVGALRQLLQAGRQCHLALTPDGPRGPRRCVQPGLAYLAARTGLPVVPVGFGLERPWRLSSWDCMALPRPGARACCVTGPPIHVPADADRSQLEGCRQEIELAMNSTTRLAERWAATGTWPARLADEELPPPSQAVEDLDIACEALKSCG